MLLKTAMHSLSTRKFLWAVRAVWMLVTEFTTPLINNRWWLDKMVRCITSPVVPAVLESLPPQRPTTKCSGMPCGAQGCLEHCPGP